LIGHCVSPQPWREIDASEGHGHGLTQCSTIVRLRELTVFNKHHSTTGFDWNTAQHCYCKHFDGFFRADSSNYAVHSYYWVIQLLHCYYLRNDCSDIWSQYAKNIPLYW